MSYYYNPNAKATFWLNKGVERALASTSQNIDPWENLEKGTTVWIVGDQEFIIETSSLHSVYRIRASNSVKYFSYLVATPYDFDPGCLHDIEYMQIAELLVKKFLFNRIEK